MIVLTENSDLEVMATASSAYLKLLQMGTKIVAVGRNYAAHAKELGNAVPKVSPANFLFLFFFLHFLTKQTANHKDFLMDTVAIYIYFQL